MERNYDMGNRELLAVVWALQEWRHWLKGTEVPSIIWTNHMNARQVRWVFFFESV